MLWLCPPLLFYKYAFRALFMKPLWRELVEAILSFKGPCLEFLGASTTHLPYGSVPASLWIVPAFALRANFLMLPLFRTFHSPARSLTTHIYNLTNQRLWFIWTICQHFYSEKITLILNILYLH